MSHRAYARSRQSHLSIETIQGSVQNVNVVLTVCATLLKPLTDLQRYIVITTRAGLCTFFRKRVVSRRFMILYLFREVNLQGGIFVFIVIGS